MGVRVDGPIRGEIIHSQFDLQKVYERILGLYERISNYMSEYKRIAI
jgi:hypothetical protein